MRSIVFITTALLVTLVAAIDTRNEHKSAKCFTCPPVKSFRFGIRPWQRYEPSDIKFQQHEHTFSCIYKAVTYATDKHDPLTVIGRCNFYNDGVLRHEIKDKDTASSLECPREAPSYKGCGYRAHVARAIEERQEPGEQTPQEYTPTPTPAETGPGELVVDENEPDENETEEPENELEEGDEEEEEDEGDDDDEGENDEDEDEDDEEDEADEDDEGEEDEDEEDEEDEDN